MVLQWRSLIALLLVCSLLSSLALLSLLQFNPHRDVPADILVLGKDERFHSSQNHCLPHTGNCTRLQARSWQEGVGEAPDGNISKEEAGPSVFARDDAGPYYDLDLFHRDFEEMLNKFRVYVYPDVYKKNNTFAKVFVPHESPFDQKLGNYFSEHMFKISLLNSTFITSNPEEAKLFFLPFSVNALRNDPRVKAEKSIANFVAQYVEQVSSQFDFWNRTKGADHFYVCCHSVGRNIASEVPSLRRNSIQVVCSSSYYHKLYITHKDVAMPQIWPRVPELSVTPPHKRTRLAFYAGRAQNSRVRARLLDAWQNDTDLDIYSEWIHGSYEEAFRKSKFCLHVKGYDVNTARIADAIHFGCVPVIISDHYDLPFANVLDWKKFSIIVSHVDIHSLKSVLQSISDADYLKLHDNVCRIRVHFQWDVLPSRFDSFHMTMYQLWLMRGIVRPSIISHR